MAAIANVAPIAALGAALAFVGKTWEEAKEKAADFNKTVAELGLNFKEIKPIEIMLHVRADEVQVLEEVKKVLALVEKEKKAKSTEGLTNQAIADEQLRRNREAEDLRQKIPLKLVPGTGYATSLVPDSSSPEWKAWQEAKRRAEPKEMAAFAAGKVEAAEAAKKAGENLDALMKLQIEAQRKVELTRAAGKAPEKADLELLRLSDQAQRENWSPDQLQHRAAMSAADPSEERRKKLQEEYGVHEAERARDLERGRITERQSLVAHYKEALALAQSDFEKRRLLADQDKALDAVDRRDKAAGLRAIIEDTKRSVEERKKAIEDLAALEKIGKSKGEQGLIDTKSREQIKGLKPTGPQHQYRTPDVDRLERIGIFVGGMSNSLAEHARATANNTKVIADWVHSGALVRTDSGTPGFTTA
jgi:hypothetical protein